MKVSWDFLKFPTEWKIHVPNHQPVIMFPIESTIWEGVYTILRRTQMSPLGAPSSTGAANAQSWNPSRCPSESLGLKLGLMVDTWAPIYCIYVCIYIYGMWLMWIYLNNDGYLGPKSGIQLRLIHTGIQAAIGVLRTSCIIPWTLHSGGSPIGRSESGLIAYFRICVWRALSLCLEMPRTSDVPEPSKG